MKALIIDDSSTMRKIITATLGQIGGFTVDTAGDGQEGLTKFAEFKPDIILLDWNMPNMNGLQFLTALRGCGSKTPVVMVTTEAEKSRVIQAMQAGANNYVIKPFTAEILSKRIQDTLSRTKAA